MEQHVYVVLSPTNRQINHLVVSANPGQVGPQLRLPFSFNGITPVLGAKTRWTWFREKECAIVSPRRGFILSHSMPHRFRGGLRCSVPSGLAPHDLTQAEFSRFGRHHKKQLVSGGLFIDNPTIGKSAIRYTIQQGRMLFLAGQNGRVGIDAGQLNDRH